MNLIIDLGNTQVKLAVFDHGICRDKVTTAHKDYLNEINTLYLKYPKITRAILASVNQISDNNLKQLQDLFELLVLDSLTKVPFKNCYQTPLTLGVDRVALISAAVHKYPKKNVLIIDAGTCITYDFVDDQMAYHGGAISPGIRVRYKALHNQTANLPLLVIKKPMKMIGNSTTECIHSGVINGVLLEIEGMVAAYEKKYPDLIIVLTGGDAKFLSKQLKSSIFANSNFLLEGLNTILEFNNI